MTKKNTVSKKNIVSNVFPEVKTVDDLAVMGDDELYNHLDVLFNTAKELRTTRETLAWEKEICYAQRELQIRALRRKAMDAVQSQYEDVVSEDEDSYPEAELDNIEFVNLARRIEATRERARNRERRAVGNSLSA